MTLVRARRLETLIYCIAETSSFVPALQLSNRAIEEPYVKILPISRHVVLAFAGNSYHLDRVTHADLENDAVSTLEQISASANGEIEFLVIDKRQWKLVHIDHRGARESVVVTLGAQEPKEALQRERLDPTAPKDLAALELFEVPSSLEPECEEYFKDLRAFQRILETPTAECAGLAIPYVVACCRSRGRHPKLTPPALRTQSG
jgi:hypothetical protein